MFTAKDRDGLYCAPWMAEWMRANPGHLERLTGSTLTELHISPWCEIDQAYLIVTGKPIERFHIAKVSE